MISWYKGWFQGLSFKVLTYGFKICNLSFKVTLHLHVAQNIFMKLSTSQRRIQNPVKHPRWSILQKHFTAKIR